MPQIQVIKKCPNRVITKAESILNEIRALRHGKCKKLSGLKNVYSIKVDHDYRILISDKQVIFIGSHASYEKKIKIMKRKRG